MKNGWYGFIKHVKFDNKMVYVVNDKIVATKDEYSGEINDTNMDVTPELKEKMAILEWFDGLGIA